AIRDEHSCAPEPHQLLGESHGTDTDHLSREENVRLHARHHDLGHARHLLLEYAAQDVLAIQHDHHVEQERDHEAEDRAHEPAAAAPALVDAFGRHVYP